MGPGVKIAVFKEVLPWLDVCTFWQKFFTDSQIRRLKSLIQKKSNPAIGTPSPLEGGFPMKGTCRNSSLYGNQAIFIAWLHLP